MSCGCCVTRSHSSRVGPVLRGLPLRQDTAESEERAAAWLGCCLQPSSSPRPGPEPPTASSGDCLPDLVACLGARGLRAPRPRVPFPRAPPRGLPPSTRGRSRDGDATGPRQRQCWVSNGDLRLNIEDFSCSRRLSRANVQSPRGSVRPCFV